MPTAMDSAVIERLAVRSAVDPADLTPSALPGFVLAELEWEPEQLPARTAFVVSGPDLPPALGADEDGDSFWATDSSDLALRHAHRVLQRGTADLAVVVALGEPEENGFCVFVLRRAAESLAQGEFVYGLLGRAASDDRRPGTPVWSAEELLDPADRAAAVTAEPEEEHPRDDFGLHLRPAALPDTSPGDPLEPRLLLWSGQDAEDEARSRQRLRAEPDLPSPYPAGTAPGPVRAHAVTTGVAADAGAALDAAKTGRTGRPGGAAPRPVVLLLPGQGSQHVRMARGLYGHEPVFTAAIDAALHVMGDEGKQVRADWLGDTPTVDIDDVRRAQPLLLAVDYALARMVLGWGVRPAAILGHSAGELVGGALSGVFSLPDAVRMMHERVREAVKVPPGGMLAVAASEEQLRPYLLGDVAIAAVNAGQQTMLAGSVEPLREISARLRADEFAFRAVPATSPFHCPAMAPVAEATERAFETIRLSPPIRRLYSGYTGALLTAGDALDPNFWGRQVTDTVYFKSALDRLLEESGDVLLVEAGPGQTLTAFARRHRAVKPGLSEAIPLLPARPGDATADRRSVLAAAGRIWAEGHDLDVAAVSRLWSTPSGAVPSVRIPKGA